MAYLKLKNTTAGDIFIGDVGISIPGPTPGPAEDEFSQDSILRAIAASADVRARISAGTLVVNNGSSDLSVTAGLKYLADLWSSGGLDTLPTSRAKYQFGRSIAVPSGGSQQLLGAGNTTAGYRMQRACTITAASIQVNTPDASRAYNLEIRINGSNVATLALAINSTGAHSTSLAIAVNAGDVLTAFLMRTSGSSASTFTNETAVVEVTE
jgi:hypothetical protein